MVILGIVGLFMLLLYDLASLRQLPKRSALAVLGYGIHTVAIAAAACAAGKIVLPLWCGALGWLLFGSGAAWLCYCLFLYKPLASTYKADGELTLTTAGPYAFSRHPGFWGHTFLLAGLFLATESALLLKGGFFWILANFFYIVLQDRWLFPQLFRGYSRYRQTVPMLFPSRTSLQRFWLTK